MTELSLLIRATVILVVGLGAVGVARGASASTRALWLAFTFGALLLFPLATAALPPAPIVVPMPTAASSVFREALPPAHRAPSPALAAPVPSRASARPTSLREWLDRVWLVGAALSTLPLWLAVTAASRLRRTGTSWPRGTRTFDTQIENRTARRVGIIRVATLRVPCTIGFLRPVIAFPQDADEWNDEEIRRVLIHEYEHVRRGDWLIVLTARLVCSLYWFHPLAWLALRRLRIETEQACDDAVVRSDDAPAYAEQLVTLATRLSKTAVAPVLSMAGHSELAARVSSILDSRRRRLPTTRGSRWLTTATGSAMAGAIAVAQLAPMQAAQRRPTPIGRILPPEQGDMGAEAADGGARLSGVLYDPFGQPLGGVTIGIESLRFGNPPVPPRSTPFFRAKATDANGRFTFDRVPPGLYGLAAPATDFVPGEQLVLHADEQVTRDIHMRIEPATATITVCRDCSPQSNAFELPESIRRELERDEQIALSAPVAAPEPVTQVLTGEVASPYPPSLAGRSLEGHVVVEGVIGADGAGQTMRVTSETHPALGVAAMQLLASERWKPAFVRGVAVDAPFRVEVRFVLR
jgi:beta-lactamase regulating signal transducer with metallopeptidase domain